MVLPPVATESLIAMVDHVPGGPLERLRNAVTLSAALATQGDEVVDHFVDLARKDGCSWSQIGEQLGVTRQAAQQRFVSPTANARSGRFKRLTPESRTVVAHAQEEARSLAHNYVGTEHLLLGLLAIPRTLATEVLEELGVSPSKVRTRIEEVIGRGSCRPDGAISFTPRFKKVLQIATDQATAVGDGQVAPEHLLLGLLEESEGVAAQVLRDLGSSADRVRSRLSAVLGRPLPEPRPRRRRRRHGR